MGLIYSSSDSQNLIEGMNTNLSIAKAAVQDMVSASHTLTASIGAGKLLDGAAFSAGKDLFSALIIPTITRASSAFDDTKNHLSRYESANSEVSGEGVLNEDKLNAKKTSTQAIKVATDNTASTFRALASAADGISLPIVGPMLNDAAQNLEHYSDSLQQDIDKINQKLQKLHEFNSAVNGLFNDDLNNLKQIVQNVTLLSDTVINTKTGGYTLPKGTDGSWFTKLATTSVQTSIIEGINKKAEEKIMEKGAAYGAGKAADIFDSRYSITTADGKILGKIPGATKAAMTGAEDSAKSLAKYGGKAVTGTFGLVAGVGIDMATGDSAQEAWGKEITTTVTVASIGGAIELGSSALVTVGLISNPIGLGIVGTIAIGVGVSMLNDTLRDHFSGVKKFEDNVGNAVVSGWNHVAKGVSSFFGGVFG
ncbi:T7SS effector LXG polymorphic toxin [Lactococcus protaetiae]|uniref:LXG domain-containing protein n=1 Tax=Lactococcus protaetiae TaxID=2592653 RepID=A0A514Z9W9_9LACT|nr:T7SS effector LXG polymorphic toxin [Lactococcus protaetiae]QDK71384.1 hypothetical protein FLP15_09730 [Lactococcus protaetiae]